MNRVSRFVHTVREVEHFEIRMSDGCRLAARMWLPEDALDNPVPAILEYIPYRKNDLTAKRDAVMHPYVAGHGYAVVRVDLRGAGDSDGVLTDEYLQQELDDGYEVIAWLAAQPWCDGNVGMVGISWGGFNGLQVAAMQPPALKAVVSCASTDDRYADDVHYMGGCLLIDNLSWASIMFGRNTLPPDPRNRPDDWRAIWLDRLDNSGLWLKTWLEHQTRDEFWRHGSVCEDFSRVTCPVYAVSGWADGYCRSVFRLMESLPGPRKGLVGPWAHTYPHMGRPGPAIGFLQEMIRWWDHWLKGKDTGIMDEPMLRLFMQEGATPEEAETHREGRWVAERSWPSPGIVRRGFHLRGDGSLATQRGVDGQEAPCRIRSPLWVGLGAGKWCSYAVPGDQPADQRWDDSGSLTFETEPLTDPLEIAGDPILHLEFESDRPIAVVAARIVDVAPDGSATRITYGVFNLTHRDGHADPAPLEPGRRYQVQVPLKHVAQRVAPGHRLRLSISSNYFPLIWPSPESVTLTVHPARCHLDLPLREPRAEDDALAAFPPAEGAPPLDVETVSQPETYWRVVGDLGGHRTAVEICEGGGTWRIRSNDLTIFNRGRETYAFERDDANSVSGEVRWEHRLSRGGWTVRSMTETRLSADSGNFYIEARLRAWEGETLVRDHQWHETVPRRWI